MNRRTLLRALIASGLAATLDPERLLWVPKQMIAVPTMPAITHGELWTPHSPRPLFIIHATVYERYRRLLEPDRTERRSVWATP